MARIRSEAMAKKSSSKESFGFNFLFLSIINYISALNKANHES